MVFSNKSKHLMKIFTQNKNLFAVQHTKKTDEIFTELYYKILGAYNYVNQNKGVSFTPFLFDRSACNAHSGAFSSAKSNCSMRIENAQRCKSGVELYIICRPQSIIDNLLYCGNINLVFQIIYNFCIQWFAIIQIFEYCNKIINYFIVLFNCSFNLIFL